MRKFIKQSCDGPTECPKKSCIYVVFYRKHWYAVKRELSHGPSLPWTLYEEARGGLKVKVYFTTLILWLLSHKFYNWKSFVHSIRANRLLLAKCYDIKIFKLLFNLTIFQVVKPKQANQKILKYQGKTRQIQLKSLMKQLKYMLPFYYSK